MNKLISNKQINKYYKFQLKQKNWFQEVFIKRNAWGIFSNYSHWKKDGNEKQIYASENQAIRAAEAMEKRYNNKYAVYCCMFCGGFHIGKKLKP